MQKFKDYIWQYARQGILISGILLLLFTMTIYMAVILFSKNKQLASSLEVADYTVKQSIAAGDWALALGHLTVLEKSGPMFNIELSSNQINPIKFSGPIGQQPIGIGNLCKKSLLGDGLELGACVKVFNVSDGIVLLFFVMLIVGMFFLVFRQFRTKILIFTDRVSVELKNISESSESHSNLKNDEIIEIVEIRNYVLRLLNEVEIKSKSSAYYQLSLQVAHDIRSPLAALNAIVKQTQNIPEQQRIMLRGATQQINDIANNLLEKYRTEKNESNHLNAEIISLLLDSVISEKRAQYAELPIEIELNIEVDAHGLFCQIIAVDFKRVISNLINNAVEAIQNKGNISINLSQHENSASIIIQDNGIGMPENLIEKVMKGESVSHKKSGHGIGLVSARKMIEQWNGHLTIISEMGKGTTLKIILPLVSPAEWFADKLYFTQNNSVIILDDDPSIHDVWKSRIETEIPNVQLQLTHYDDPEKLLKSCINNNSAKYLCDYELLGHSLTGLDVIEKLGLKSNQVVLVTSRYDEPVIRARCQKNEIKILPKNYASYVPFVIEENKLEIPSQQIKPDLILIDDNKILTTSWKFAAEIAGKEIVIFNDIIECEKNIHQYDHESLIYIDSNLGEHIKGEDYAKDLYHKNYKNIYLSTGYDASCFDLKNYYWIKGIVGKEPDF